MSGIFGDLDVAGAEELSTGVPAGVYPATVTNAEVVNGTKNSPDSTFLVISYTVEGYDFPIREYKQIPKGHPSSWDDNVKDTKNKTEKQRNNTALSFLKARLNDLGVPVERMNSLQPEYLVGTQVIVTVVKNAQGYSNITKVAQPGDSGVTLPAATVPPTGASVTPITAAPTLAGIENPFAKK